MKSRLLVLLGISNYFSEYVTALSPSVVDFELWQIN